MLATVAVLSAVSARNARRCVQTASTSRNRVNFGSRASAAVATVAYDQGEWRMTKDISQESLDDTLSSVDDSHLDGIAGGG